MTGPRPEILSLQHMHVLENRIARRKKMAATGLRAKSARLDRILKGKSR